MTTNTTQAQGVNQQQKEYLWPALPYEAWKDTLETLHMETQIVGKVALELVPFLNQWWEVALSVTARGLETMLIPSPTGGAFQIGFDFIDHNLAICTSDGRVKELALMERTVADFYKDFMAALQALSIQVKINTKPVEVGNGIPFEQDTTHRSYDPEYVNRWWRILVQTTRVLEQYRSYFRGKSSPILFFWGTFDLAEARYSGKRASPPQGADRIMRFSANEEGIECGFWPGSSRLQTPAFYSFTYPEPQGLKNASIKPSAAHYDNNLGEFILRYDDVRQSNAPEQTLLDFFQSTYEVGAKLAHWNTQELEQQPPQIQ
ncbi:MAG TPA: DUF5996 family protein [Ktedonobacteraceae bacterium]|nr:DUF5996 family protein [Ktedonobacteraceae bacterium]